jgi:hypothetical protein
MTDDAKPDFEALRAVRNAAVRSVIERIAKEQGIPIETVRSSFNSNACYCDCANHGPCEHDWDGEPYDGDGCWSRTCSRCGTTAMSHDMRCLP